MPAPVITRLGRAPAQETCLCASLEPLCLGRIFLVQDLIPFAQLVRDLRQQCAGVAFDREFLDDIVLGDAVDDFLVIAADHGAEYSVLAIQVRRRAVGDEKLAAVGAWSCIGHRQDAGLVVTQFGHEFVFEVVAGTAHAAALRTAALDHEIADDAMKLQSIIVAALGQVDEIGNGDGGLIGKKVDIDGAFAGFHDGF